MGFRKEGGGEPPRGRSVIASRRSPPAWQSHQRGDCHADPRPERKRSGLLASAEPWSEGHWRRGRVGRGSERMSSISTCSLPPALGARGGGRGHWTDTVRRPERGNLRAVHILLNPGLIAPEGG